MSEEEGSFDRQQLASSSADLDDPPVYRSLASMEDEWQEEEQSAFLSAAAIDPFDDDAPVYRSLASLASGEEDEWTEPTEEVMLPAICRQRGLQQ